MEDRIKLIIKRKSAMLALAVCEYTGFPITEAIDEMRKSEFYKLLSDKTTLLWTLPNEELVSEYFRYTEEKDIHK